MCIYKLKDICRSVRVIHLSNIYVCHKEKNLYLAYNCNQVEFMALHKLQYLLGAILTVTQWEHITKTKI